MNKIIEWSRALGFLVTEDALPNTPGVALVLIGKSAFPVATRDGYVDAKRREGELVEAMAHYLRWEPRVLSHLINSDIEPKQYAKTRKDLSLVSEAIGWLGEVESELVNIDPYGGAPYLDEDYKVEHHHRIQMYSIQKLRDAAEHFADCVKEVHSQMHSED